MISHVRCVRDGQLTLRACVAGAASAGDAASLVTTRASLRERLITRDGGKIVSILAGGSGLFRC